MTPVVSPIQALGEAARSSLQLRMNARFELSAGTVLDTIVNSIHSPQGCYVFLTLRPSSGTSAGSQAASVGDALREIARKYPKARLQHGSVKVAVDQGQVTGSALKLVATQSLYEAFGLPIPTPEDLAAAAREAKAAKKGAGADPRLVTRSRRERSRPKPTDFTSFLDRLKLATDKAKLDKALAMLKADRFRLFARVKDDHLVGVVKSQSDPTLVYSCRLGADGAYSCCTQNLNVCGGLRGSPCKHLLVLVVGLTQAGELDPGTAHEWSQASRGRRPAWDRDLMAETLLQYKGAEAGEVDWRPTETIPEDFYAM